MLTAYSLLFSLLFSPPPSSVWDMGRVRRFADNRIDLVYLWILADLLGEHAVASLRQKSFEAMFSRFARQISPAGAIPSYGDSGGANTGQAAGNWTGQASWDNQWGGFVAGFTRAGVEWSSGAFASAAQTMFTHGRQLQPLGGKYNDISAAFRLLFATAWGGSATMPQPDPAAFAELAGYSVRAVFGQEHCSATLIYYIIYPQSKGKMP